MKPEYSCAITTFSIKGWEAGDISGLLFEKWKIHTTTSNQENVHGVRVTPHIYTSLGELDLLVSAIEELAAKEPPRKKDSKDNQPAH